MVLTQYEKVFDNCITILQNTNDLNMKSKESRLTDAFNKLCKLKEPTQEFYSIVHEITMYDFLVKHNISTIASSDLKGGPDFLSDIGYIECVSITMGTKGTAERKWIDKQLKGNMNRYLSALPRLSSVIWDKQKIYNNYIEKGVVDTSTPLIIAVSSAMFTKEFCGDSIFELAMKILYGIGSLTFPFNIANHSFISQKGIENHVYENIGRKSEIQELELNYFADNKYNIISAVLVTTNVINEDLEDRHVSIFVNPNAKNKLNINKINNIRCLVLDNIINKGNVEILNYKWINYKDK